MRLSVLFGQRKESYEGEYAPEVLLVRDEYTIDENPVGWKAEVEHAKKSYQDDMLAMRVIDLEVDQDRIRRLLVVTPVVKAEIE